MTEAVQIALIAATPPTIVALAAAWLGWLNRAKLTQVHLDMNGRLTQLLESRQQEGHSQGMRDQAAQDANVPRGVQIPQPSEGADRSPK